jgi:hypothetical protein
MNYSAVSTSACAASAIPFPIVFGAEILNLSAVLVQNFIRDVSDQLFYNHPSISVKGIDYCNVTVTYTHPGQNDTINVETWLPLNTWNGRLQAVGDGGYVAGRFPLSNIEMARGPWRGLCDYQHRRWSWAELYPRPMGTEQFWQCRHVRTREPRSRVVK